MTALEYLSIRLGNKITQVISTDNIHIINGKVVVDMGKEKNEATEKAYTRAETVCVSTSSKP
jgi:hypothetical protein